MDELNSEKNNQKTDSEFADLARESARLQREIDKRGGVKERKNETPAVEEVQETTDEPKEEKKKRGGLLGWVRNKLGRKSKIKEPVLEVKLPAETVDENASTETPKERFIRIKEGPSIVDSELIRSEMSELRSDEERLRQQAARASSEGERQRLIDEADALEKERVGLSDVLNKKVEEEIPIDNRPSEEIRQEMFTIGKKEQELRDQAANATSPGETQRLMTEVAVLEAARTRLGAVLEQREQQREYVPGANRGSEMLNRRRVGPVRTTQVVPRADEPSNRENYEVEANQDTTSAETGDEQFSELPGMPNVYRFVLDGKPQTTTPQNFRIMDGRVLSLADQTETTDRLTVMLQEALDTGTTPNGDILKFLNSIRRNRPVSGDIKQLVAARETEGTSVVTERSDELPVSELPVLDEQKDTVVSTQAEIQQLEARLERAKEEGNKLEVVTVENLLDLARGRLDLLQEVEATEKQRNKTLNTKDKKPGLLRRFLGR
jgi:hypothetical protein